MRFARPGIVAAALVLAVAAAAAAAETYYDLGKNGDNKVNISWESKATVETIVGRSTKCDGIVILSADKPETSYVKVSVPVDSIRTGIDMRDGHLQSDQWLDAKKFPTIDFESSSVKAVAGQEHTYDVTGKLKIHGVEKEYTVRGKAMPLKALSKDFEKMGYKGDMVHLEAAWDVTLADHGINVPENLAIKVAPKVRVTIDVFGFTNDKPQREDPRKKG